MKIKMIKKEKQINLIQKDIQKIKMKNLLIIIIQEKEKENHHKIKIKEKKMMEKESVKNV